MLTSPQDPLDPKELEELIISIQKGNIERYVFIVRVFQTPIYRYCYRLLENKQDAEDAVQDILVKGYQSIHQYKSQMNFSAWLYRIAYHHCLNLLRRRRLQKRVMSIFKPEFMSASPEQELDDRLFNPSLSTALAQLSLEERNMLVLRVFEEKSYAEISEILGVSPNALTKRMNRIKLKVQEAMKSEEEIRWNEPQSAMNTKM
ncbi:RNA polymerase sigma factor [Paenibacillus sp. G2S3]|uniref:RNA polymerase sigma factor n=1 Tax=Paenibacillus sp. G2S3 TaxID=3047872 RepID=UPI0024C1AFD1|nr:RNA polymerase sigma factor [Paenibacillus sp. G2S3]WHY19795.1 RNA polymerase sigma factor [Paenibacillus sp. G2S3]